MRYLHILDREGPEEFSATLSVQTNLLHAKIADRSLADVLIYVEHQEVYTVGRSVGFQEPTRALDKAVRWIEIGRGGKATFHGPGQLVAYPIFDLHRHGKDVHLFLRSLERAAIACLARFGIRGRAREGHTGVWVDAGGWSLDVEQRSEPQWKKIASLGIGVKRWVSCHGMALNVSTDLGYFRAISPCDEEGSVMTSVEQLLGEAPPLCEVKQALTRAMCDIFELEYMSSLNGSMPSSSGRRVERRARPGWLKAKAPGSEGFLKTQKVVRSHKLVTVCEEARCPNIGECWSHGTATFMVMGELCTRRCSFCSVKDGTLGSLDALDPLEPLRVAQAVKKLNLRHVVVTSVNRDDYPDMGAEHFNQTVRAIAYHAPQCDIELLIPDMRGKRPLVETVLQSGRVTVLNHNVETVPRLYRQVRPGAVFQRSLDILRWAKEIAAEVRTKSGVMVGLGECREEVLEVMDALRESKVEVLTIGQSLQPTPAQLPVQRFVTPGEFEQYRIAALNRGFLHVESGPLVRSSYHAWQHTGRHNQCQN